MTSAATVGGDVLSRSANSDSSCAARAAERALLLQPDFELRTCWRRLSFSACDAARST